jgi:hypothetical protein
VRGEWRSLDKHEATTVLFDGRWHEFDARRVPAVDAIRLCQISRNGLGSTQMHLGGFSVCGDVIGARELLHPDVAAVAGHRPRGA